MILAYVLFLVPTACTDTDRAPQPTDDDAAPTTDPLPFRIELSRLASISDSAIPGGLTGAVFVTRDRHGRFYTASRTEASILVFGPDGAFLHALGRRGAGPAEYRMPVPPRFGPADSMFVFDMQLRRVMVLSPEGEYVRSFGSPVMGGKTLILTGGSMVVAEDIRTRDRVGYPLHAMSPRGELIRSFGSDTPQYRPDLSALTRRVIGHAGDRQVWSARTTAYVIERWDPTTGARTAVIERKVPWFQPYLKSPGSARAVEPRPLITAVWQDSAERLWVVIRVADSKWKPLVPSDTAAAQAMRHDPAAAWTPELRDQTYDRIIEVIDIGSHELLAHFRIDENFNTMGGADGAVLAFRTAEDAVATRYDLWEPRLVPTHHDRR